MQNTDKLKFVCPDRIVDFDVSECPPPWVRCVLTEMYLDIGSATSLGRKQMTSLFGFLKLVSVKS